MRLVLLGGPGAGKGTQAKQLEGKYQVRQLSTGDILRAAVEAGTNLGKNAREYMDEGRLVPDELVLELISETLKSDEYSAGFVLDGFPRTIAQAEGLDRLLKELRLSLDAVVSIEVPDTSIVKRLGDRRSCECCGALFNLRSCAPAVSGVCDDCGGQLIQREDDKPETVLRRLEVYHQQTEPLKAYYAERGLLRSIDGDRSVEAIFDDLEKVWSSGS